MQGLEIEGLAGLGVLALPLVALAVVMLRATRRRVPAGPGRLPSPVTVTGRYGAPVGPLAPPRPTAPAAPIRKPAVEPVAPTPSAVSVAELEAGVAGAEAKGDEARLADLYLALARRHMADNAASKAALLLRKCIVVSTRIDRKDAHAAARLELGDLARNEGDLTTACEHWQIARGLYLTLKKPQDQQAADTRMRRHGCPTDWVLNDF